MIMQNSELDPQDQRKTSSMEDSTAMTIEFLRARLLSERSVSRSARQRADELAKRVMELEEQLKVVTLQRKMAENATVEVLAILDSQGISDMSEEFDFASDEEIPCESGIGDDSAKDGERSRRRNVTDELSSSDMDSSSVPGKSLSWKGRVDFPRSLEKYKASNVRRRSNFSSVSSSPKHCQGKSCRQIRREETRSVVKESKDEPIQNKSKENEAVCLSEGFPNFSNDGSYILRKDSTIQGEDESEGKLGNNDHDIDEYGREKDMEKALEHQAQLIGRYEAMEKAQREWEEKFRENNNSTPDSCDPGNHSDITEETEDSKAQISSSARTVTSDAQEAKSEAGGVSLSEEMAKTEPRSDMPESLGDAGYHNQKNTTVITSGFLSQENSHSPINGKQNHESLGNSHRQPFDGLHQDSLRHDSPGYKPASSFPYHNQKNTTVITSGFLSQENSHSPMNGKQNHESLGNSHRQPFDGLHQDSLRHDSPGYKPASSFPTDVYSRLPQENASRNQNDLYALVPHEQSHGLGGVLESLKQAKLSIQQELSKLPVVEAGYASRATMPSASMSKSEDRFEIPVGCSGLFRLPTDYSDGATARSGFSDPVSQFSPNFYPDKGIPRTSGDHGSSPYPGTRLSFPAEDQSFANRYIESGSQFDAKKLPLDPFLYRGLSSDNFMYSTFPIHPSNPNSTPRMPFGDGFSRQVLSRPVGIPPADNFSFYDHQARPNMYR